MTPEERKLEEEQIMNSFSELQKKLEELKDEIQTESDESKKQEKQAEIDKMEQDLADMKTKIDTLSSLQEQDLQLLKDRLQEYSQAKQETKWEVVDLQNEKSPTPTTYELLKDSATIRGFEWDSNHPWLLKIIESNPKEFKSVPWDTAEKKLEYIFSKIRNGIVLFLKNKLWNSEKNDKVINETIAPALEWSFIEMLRDQWNEENIKMFQWIKTISLSSFGKLFTWVTKFAATTAWSYNRFHQWMNAIDYLSVYNWVLSNPENSAVLTNPVEFKNYLNDSEFRSNSFSPYQKISKNIFKISNDETFEFWMSLQEKQNVLAGIWEIKVVNSPKTTALIAKMMDKPEQFFKKTEWLQQTANGFLDSVDSLNSITKMFGVDILWEITKAPENRSFLYRVMDFVCKLIWITWWLEWIVKRWRLDRMDLSDKKNDDISKVFKHYKGLAWKNVELSITDESSCKTALKDFEVTKDAESSTKWDFLRDSIADNMDVSLVFPAVVQQILWDSYLKKETVKEKGKTKEKLVVDASKFTEKDKLKLAHNHLINMKTHLEIYKDNNKNIDLSEFYKNINSTEDIALCITASLYADKDDVIEWVKAKVFLPENYWSVHFDWTVTSESNETDSWRENLDSAETLDKQVVTEQWIYDKAKENWITDNRQIAYVLSTVKGECGFKNQPEIWRWEWKSYWAVDQSTGQSYYGRWFIQLTWKNNYARFTQIIRDSWKEFKDNDWNIIAGKEVDLVNNPDITLQSNELAAFILMYWMKNWTFTWKKLDDFINDNDTDFYNARSIVNWMSSKPRDYADNAQLYLDKINNSGLTSA